MMLHSLKHSLKVFRSKQRIRSFSKANFKTSLRRSLFRLTIYDRYKKLGWKLAAGLEYKLLGTGPVTSNIVEGGAFWWADRSEPTPDLQFHFLPGAGVVFLAIAACIVAATVLGRYHYLVDSILGIAVAFAAWFVCR